MSISAVRKPIVMTFVCEHSIGRYTNFQKSGAASALKAITDEMMFLELKRRGYDPESIRKNKTTAEIVKIGVS